MDSKPQPVEPQKPQGFGSIWNNNSWFYEDKNFTKFAKEWMTENIKRCQVTKDDVLVRLYEMKEIEGQASVIIRKQKQIFLYDLELEVYFDASRVSDPSQTCKGKIKVHEFNQDDDEVNLEITQETQSDFVSIVKKILNNEMCEQILSTFAALSEAMRQKDGAEIKLKQDAAMREQAKKQAQEAQQQKGEQKQQIFNEEQQRQAEFKIQQAELAKQNMVPMKDVTKVNKVEGSGSVWNNNSYHWEEKSVAKWSEETLKRILSLFYYKQDRATMTIKEVKDLKGESSVSIRKGKKIVTYEYSVRIVYKIDLADEANTKSIGSVEGEYEFPEISNDILDDGDEWEINASIKKGDEQLQKMFYQIIKKSAPDEIRKKIIAEYVEELKKK